MAGIKLGGKVHAAQLIWQTSTLLRVNQEQSASSAPATAGGSPLAGTTKFFSPRPKESPESPENLEPIAKILK